MTQQRLCKQCGVPMTRDRRALYCFPCQHERAKHRVRAEGKRRAGDYMPLRTADGVLCMDCKLPMQERVTRGRKTRAPLRCTVCGPARFLFLRHLSGASAAASITGMARARGDIPPASRFACADCGRPAECYDHRDYSKPLDVEPVCLSCNVMRGPAKPLHPLIVSFVLVHAQALLNAPRRTRTDHPAQSPPPSLPRGDSAPPS